ncbi:histidinol dehydrogenase [Edaphobacter sp.]|uniref:histidinol dehydrogenase n=1 Tax=Edaphobacter sp. TaxID=1934404 RepID=UPI002DBCCF2C|nr:histidinol dehydrogenase [Edaphobacter sp.]HEU5341692.1 histidinol dehydrogenase [Edaphobacter sp.]
MKLVKTFGRGAKAAEAMIETLERRGAVNTARVEPVVRKILAGVRKGGDGALRRYAAQFDGLTKAQPLAVSREEMRAAWEATAPELQAAMMVARGNILAFAEAQLPKQWSFAPADGVQTGQIVRPLGSVGCYVPGGRYPLPSTLLMTVTPAQVAGVERIVVCSPKPATETLAAAWLAGVTEFYRVGGAQAIAAMAYGTPAIARVDKIVGPGNLFVTAAKVMVSSECGIDMPAGPTEIVVTSETGSAAGIAADLVAQAEHDPEALAVLITSNEALANAVLAEVKAQAKNNTVAKKSLAAQGAIFVTKTVAEARELTNRLAPEHLTVDSSADLKWVRNAGSVFVGDYAPQSMGDYVSGPNHVLPTGRVGRVRGGLSVMDYVKVITVQEYTRTGLKKIGPHAIALAEAEGLTAHAASVRVRMR